MMLQSDRKCTVGVPPDRRSLARLQRAAIACVLCLSGQFVKGVEPAEGLYWNPGRPGEGMEVERQGGVVGVTVYSFDREGAPVFFTAAGPLVEGGSIEPTPFTEGLFLHSFTGTLFRYRGGPRFGYGHVTETLPGGIAPEAVGTIQFTSAFHGQLQYSIQFDEPDENLISTGAGSARRFLFGHAGIGQNAIFGNTPCLVSLEGEWIFHSANDRSVLERFSFGAPSIEGNPDDCPGSSPLAIEYLDSEAGAKMRCVRSASPDPYFGRVVVVGCELSRNGVPLLWFSLSDIGISSIVATKGAIPSPTPTYNPLRGTERVLGTRIERLD